MNSVPQSWQRVWYGAPLTVRFVVRTFAALAPAGFETAWIPNTLSDAEKIEHLRDVYAASHPRARGAK